MLDARRRRRADRDEELERAAHRGAARPASGREIDDRVLPAEAGLDRARGLVHEGLLPGPGADRAPALPRASSNRRLRVLDARGRGRPGRARSGSASKAVGRVTSAVPGASRSRTSAPRCRTTRSLEHRRRKRAATLDRLRARSSGDRALPCGGRGRSSNLAGRMREKPPRRLHDAWAFAGGRAGRTPGALER